MRRKLFGGFLATVLAVTSICGAAFADTTTSNITGSGSVIAAKNVFDVIIPANLNYAVDVEGILAENSDSVINTDNSAIYSASYGVINHSSTPIKVDIEISAADTNEVTVETAETVAANNALTSAEIEDISTAPTVNLAIAPIATKAAVTATAYAVTNTDGDVTATNAAVTFTSTDVVTDKALAISTDAATISFAVEEADYTVSKGAISLETTQGGLVVSGDATSLERIYTGGQAYVDDPVVGFTIIGDANIYADWSAVTDLPEITATFTITSLTAVEFGSLTFDTDADCLLVTADKDLVATDTITSKLTWEDPVVWFDLGETPDIKAVAVDAGSGQTKLDVSDVQTSGTWVGYDYSDYADADSVDLYVQSGAKVFKVTLWQ